MRVDLSAAALAVARGQPLTSLGALNQVAENRRNWAWQALRRHFNRGSMVSYVFYGPFDLQPRGDRLFVREAASGARTAVYDLRKRTRGTLDLGYNVPLAVSPDGARMVRGFLSDGQLIVTSTEDGATLDAVASPLAEIDAMAWSDDGATLVLANGRGEIGAIDLATGATQRVDTGWTRRDGKAVEVRIADHFVFAAIEGGDAVHAWRLPTLGAPGELRRFPLGDWTVSRLAAARVGGVLRVAVGTEQGAIALLDAERAGAVRRVDFASTPVRVIAIEPRRALLVASCVEGVDRRCGILQAWDLATDEPAGALEARRSVASAAFSVDGETLFMGGGFGELKRYSVERDLLAPSIGGAAWRVEHMSLANGGRMVVSTADGAYWWNWDGDRQASGARPERWPLPSEAIAGRRFAVLSIARDAARVNGTAFIRADMQVDLLPSAAAIDKQLADLEKQAQQKGVAIGIATAYPVTLERLKVWALTLEQKGLVLVPTSALTTVEKAAPRPAPAHPLHTAHPANDAEPKSESHSEPGPHP
jgi:hypothetical protein